MVKKEIKTIFDRIKIHKTTALHSSVDDRIKKIRSIQNYIIENEDAFYDVMHKDLGRDKMDVVFEGIMLFTEIDYVVKNLRKWLKPKKIKNNLNTKGLKMYTLYEPKGTVLIMSPWNAPLAGPLLPLVSAIAAGNVSIVKPSEHSKHTSQLIKKMIDKLFVDEDVVLINGDVSVASSLLDMPFDHIFLIGGTNVGKSVMKKAAENLSSITLELGGKSPAVIDKNTDIKNSVKKIVWAKCANAGQTCVAPDHLYVHADIEDVFIKYLKKEIIRVYGNNMSKGIIENKNLGYCRIINKNHTLRIQSLINDALEKGAILSHGGNISIQDKYVEPTILSNVNHNMSIMKEEVFAPVIPIISFSTKEEIIKHVQGINKPLAFYVHSRDREFIDYFIKNTSSGSFIANNYMIQAGLNPLLPFGGVNHSGFGRMCGLNTFESFSNMKSIIIQPLGLGDKIKSSFIYPPYSSLFKKSMYFMFKKKINIFFRDI